MDLPALIDPIQHEHFRHNGRDFSVCTNGHFYPRPNISALVALLEYVDPGPVYTKTGKLAARQPAPHQDQSLEFYQAACYHYGLPHYKTKDRVKKCLLDAISEAPKKNLKVPQPILQLEKNMAKDFVKLNKKAHKAREKEAKIALKAKEKAEAAKKPAAVKSKAKVPEASTSKAASTPAGPSKTTADKSTPATKKDAKSTTAKKESTSTGAVVKKEAADKKPTIKKEPVEKKPAVEKEPIEKKPTVKKEVADKKPVVKKEVKTEAKPEASTSKAAGKKRKIEDDAEEDRKPGTSEGSNAKKAKTTSAAKPSSSTKGGSYLATVPYITEQWGHMLYGHQYTLDLVASRPGKHLWGRFDFGIVEGYMRSLSLPTNQTIDQSSTIRFQWRGPEREGPITFERKNLVTIDFSSTRAKGNMWCSLFGQISFTANLSPRTQFTAQDSMQWREEYRSLNQSRFDCESSSRWGGWGGEPEPDRAMESDSDFEEMRSDELDHSIEVDEQDYGYGHAFAL